MGMLGIYFIIFFIWQPCNSCYLLTKSLSLSGSISVVKFTTEILSSFNLPAKGKTSSIYYISKYLNLFSITDRCNSRATFPIRYMSHKMIFEKVVKQIIIYLILCLACQNCQRSVATVEL